MLPYKEKKIINAISYFAIKHKEKTGRLLYQTPLYKYLAFMDFESLKETGEPVTGLIYTAMERGPVPKEIYSEENYKHTEFYDFENIENGKVIIPTGKKADLDYFSDYEIGLMDKYIEIFAESWIRSKHMSDASHEDIFAWKRVYKREPNSEIKFKDHFPNNIYTKGIEKLKLSEEHFLFFSGLSNIK